jgi:hypothetical protein
MDPGRKGSIRFSTPCLQTELLGNSAKQSRVVVRIANCEYKAVDILSRSPMSRLQRDTLPGAAALSGPDDQFDRNSHSEVLQRCPKPSSILGMNQRSKFRALKFRCFVAEQPSKWRGDESNNALAVDEQDGFARVVGRGSKP